MDLGIVSDAWDAATDAAEDAWNAGKDFVEDAEDEIEDGLGDAADWLEDKAEDTADAIGDATDWLADEAGDAWEEIEEEGGDIFARIEAFAETRWQDARNFVGDLADTVADAVEDAWERAASIAETAWEKIAAAAEDAWNGFTAAVERAWEAIVDAVERAWDAVEDAAAWVGRAAARFYESALALLASLAEWVWELTEGVIQFIKSLGACLAGEIIYQIAMADNEIENAFGSMTYLSADVRSRLLVIYPNDSFEDVCVVDQARLSANHYQSGTDGMTFGDELGYTIYLKPRFNFSRAEIKRLLVHELMHVRQHRRFHGNLGFACAYGIGFADAGFDYRTNPLEAEAYDFVDAHVATINGL
jgi:hypothetical protein